MYIFQNNKLKDIEIKYDYPNLSVPKKVAKKDNMQTTQFGTIHFITFIDKLGKHIPYCASYQIDNKIYLFYQKKTNNNVIYDMLLHQKKNYKNTTFFIHNITDKGIYLLRELSKIIKDPSKIVIIYKQKENTIIKLKTDFITILDSFNFLPYTIKQLCQDVTDNMFENNFEKQQL